MDQTSSIHEFHVRIQKIAYYDLTPSRTVAAASRIIAYYVFRQARSGGHLSPIEARSRGRSPATPLIKYTLSHAATLKLPMVIIQSVATLFSQASAYYLHTRSPLIHVCFSACYTSILLSHLPAHYINTDYRDLYYA